MAWSHPPPPQRRRRWRAAHHGEGHNAGEEVLGPTTIGRGTTRWGEVGSSRLLAGSSAREEHDKAQGREGVRRGGEESNQAVASLNPPQTRGATRRRGRKGRGAMERGRIRPPRQICYRYGAALTGQMRPLPRRFCRRRDAEEGRGTTRRGGSATDATLYEGGEGRGVDWVDPSPALGVTWWWGWGGAQPRDAVVGLGRVGVGHSVGMEESGT